MEVKQTAENIAEKCTARDICPFKGVCEPLQQDETGLLESTVTKAEKGDIFSVDFREERRLLILRSGVFVLLGGADYAEAIPFAIFGAGNMVGLAELYDLQEISSKYYLRCLIPGEVCTISVEIARERIKSMTSGYTHKMLYCTMLSQTASSFAMTKILSRRTLYEKILALLVYLHDITGREGKRRTAFELTHEDLSVLLCSDRVSTTRALHRISEDGLIEVGYKKIIFNVENLENSLKYHRPNQDFLMLKGRDTHMHKRGEFRVIGDDDACILL